MRAHSVALIYIVWKFSSEHNHLIKVKTDDTHWALSQLLLCCLDMRTNFSSLNEKNTPFRGAAQLVGRIWNSAYPAWSPRQSGFMDCQHKILIFMSSLPLLVLLAGHTAKKKVCQNSPCAMLPFCFDFGMKSPFLLNTIKTEELLRLQNHRITESQNRRGWKGPVEGWFYSFQKRLKSSLSSCQMMA